MSARIEGLGELRRSFTSLTEDMQQRVSRRMVASAGGIVRKEARALAQQQGLRLTGALIRNIAIKREKTPEGVTQYHLGVRHGKDLGKSAARQLAVAKNGRVVNAYVDDPFYWRFLEKGRNIFRGKGRRGRELKGRVAATPFIAPALQNKQAEAIEAMAARLRTAIKKANRQ